MTVWTVVAPGPSIKYLRPKHLDQRGPVVVINNAAGAPIPRNFWSSVDPPGRFTHIWEGRSKEELHALGLIWCPERKIPAWGSVGLSAWGHPSNEAQFRQLFLPGSDPSAAITGLSILMTVSRCVGYGATEVVLYGVDLDGAGYGYGPDFFPNRTAGAWKARWKDEVGIYEKAVRVWEKAGTKITRRHLNP